jgi:hypothetical protein
MLGHRSRLCLLQQLPSHNIATTLRTLATIITIRTTLLATSTNRTMFKKRLIHLNKKKLQEHARKRERSKEEDGGDNSNRDKEADSDNDEEGQSAMEAIANAQQRHKLLSSLPLTSVNGNGGKSSSSSNITAFTSAAAKKKKTKGNDAEQPYNEPLSLLAIKHQQAMEEFISQKIDSTTGAPPNQQQSYQDPLDETALYRELAQQAAQNTTTTTTTSDTNHAPDDDNTTGGRTTKPSNDEDRDGAVLVGGTGITEVILPLQTRLDSALGKTKSSSSSSAPLRSFPSGFSSAAPPQPHGASKSFQLLPTKMAATTRNTNRTIPNSSSSSQQQQPQHPYAARNATTADPEPAALSSSTRVGFHAARNITVLPTTTMGQHNNNRSNTDNSHSSMNNHRHSNQGHPGGGGPRPPQGQGRGGGGNTDDRVFQQFMARQRDQNFR